MIPSFEWFAVEQIREVAAQTCVLTYEDPAAAPDILPGQFCMISAAPGASDIYLPRPFSYYRVRDKSRVEILFRTLGRGTRWMAGLRPGDRIGVFGPLGRPFELSPPVRRAVLVGGGIGVPPLVMLAEAFGGMENPPEIDLIYGETRGERLVDLSGSLPGNVRLWTCCEDGTKGFRGLTTELFSEKILPGLESPFAVYTCGPKAMMAALADILDPGAVTLFQASLEEHMACGHGICMGCAVPVTDQGRLRYELCCKDGPVFNGFEVKWR